MNLHWLFCSAATNSIGLVPFMKGIVDFMPSPAEAKPTVVTSGDKEIELVASDDGPFGCLCLENNS